MPEQTALVRYVKSLIFSFVFCSKVNCGFSKREFYPKAMEGVDSIASAPLGPDLSHMIDAQALLVLGNHLKIQYDANRDLFRIFVRTDPLEFWLPTDRIHNSGELPLKYVFFAAPNSLEISSDVTRFDFGRADNRWLGPERVESLERTGIRYYWGHLRERWR